MSKKRYAGQPSPADVVASLLRSRRIKVDPDRLEDRLAAERSRDKADFDQYRGQVETLALASKKARRACELDEAAWRRNSNSDTLQRAKASQQARRAADEALREELLYDEKLIAAVQNRYGR
jgi:hypothetical protein